MSYLSDAATTRITPQSEAIPGSDQKRNAAGGFGWEVTPLQRLARWLVLGSEGGTYYASERDLTRGNVDSLREALEVDAVGALTLIRDVSVEGRAPRNDEAIYALAVASAHRDPAVREWALSILPQVCRTGMHLFQFMEFVKGQRGRGRALNRAVARWYTEKDPQALAYQLVKYRQREGWTHGDVLRLVKPKPPSHEHDALFAMVTGHEVESTGGILPASARAYITAGSATDPKHSAALVRQYGSRMPREAIQPDHLSDPAVMGALVDAGMPYTALMRNLGNLTRVGALKPMTERATVVADQLADPVRIERARVHPLNVLKALVTYRSGHGFRGGGSWEPVTEVVDALDSAFYAAFKNVPKTGKRHLLALDVSGSMTMSTLAGSALTPRDGSAAMSLVTMAAGDPTQVVGFTSAGPGYHNTGISALPISPRQRLEDAVSAVSNLPFGGTDCALPMIYALREQVEVDTFVCYTDSETWAGTIHPSQALEQYRRETGIAARLVVVGMTSGGFSIADPNDPGMLDLVGFDSAAPSLISEFSAGSF